MEIGNLTSIFSQHTLWKNPHSCLEHTSKYTPKMENRPPNRMLQYSVPPLPFSSFYYSM